LMYVAQTQQNEAGLLFRNGAAGRQRSEFNKLCFVPEIVVRRPTIIRESASFLWSSKMRRYPGLDK
jgi:hypothetical protein